MRTLLTTVLAGLAVLVPPGLAAAQGTPSFGALSIGDPLFPTLGNGGYDVVHYDFHLRFGAVQGFGGDAGPVYGNETIVATATQALSGFALDYSGTAVGPVTVDEQPVRSVRYGTKLLVLPEAPIAKGATFVVRMGLATVQDPYESPITGGGSALFPTPHGTAMAGQPDLAHHTFAFNDHPADKATFTFRLDAPASEVAVANGLLLGKVTSGDRTTWSYYQRQPMAPELMQLAVGNYQVLDRGTVDGVAVRDVIPAGFEALDPQLATVVGHLRWLTARLGPYPFDTYGSLFVARDIGFSLETQTLSLINSSLFAPGVPAGAREGTMVHELAHQWFGDSVAPARWSDVWLNEGHARYYQWRYLADKGLLADLGGTGDFTEKMRVVYGYGNLSRGTFGPVAQPKGSSVSELFTYQQYEGGALALFALREEIGEDRFAALERAWVTRYKGASPSTADYIALASEIAARDVGPFLRAWLYGTTIPPMPGHPDWTAEAVGIAPLQRAAAEDATIPASARDESGLRRRP